MIIATDKLYKCVVCYFISFLLFIKCFRDTYLQNVQNKRFTVNDVCSFN